MALKASACPGMRTRQTALVVAMALPALALAQAQESVVLPEVKVKAQALSETTEGSGSYTTSGKTRTATPLGTSLRDTPQSVSVMTQQRIEDQGMRSIMDVIDNATGVSVNRFETNRVKFTSRGFDIKSLMIDGVPTTWDPTWTAGEVFSSLAIYDRVEIVRGSTGLVSGTGDPSAAVNLVRKRADSKTLTGTIEIGAGSWNQRRALADVSTPVNEAGSLRARVVGEYTQSDSWVNLKKDKSQTVFATIEADLTPNTLLSAGISRQEINSDSPMWGGLPYWYANGSRADWSRSKTTSAKWASWDSTYENWFAKLEHRFDNGWKVRASYSNGDRKGDTPLLYLFGAPDRVTGLGMSTWPGYYRNRTKQDDFGLNASGPFQLAGRTHELAFGYTYSKQKFNADSRSAPLGTAGDFNTWDGSYAEPAWGPWTFYQKDRTSQEAVYGAVRFNVSDPLKLILGARVTNWRKSGFDAAGAELYAMKFDHQVTPYAGIVYDLNDIYSVYASYTDIFQPQQVRDVNGKYLNPVLGKSSEVGVKGELLNGRLNGSLALFRIKQDKLGQATSQFVAGGTPGEIAYQESAGATSEGVEVDIAGELTTGWNVSVGYTNFTATDAKGNDVNTIYPRQLLRTFTSYRLPGTWNQLTIGGGVNWEGRSYTDAVNPLGVTDRVEQKSFTLVNLMARYDINKQLSAQLNINNLFDTKYFGMYAASNQITYGAPRNANLTLRYRF